MKIQRAYKTELKPNNKQRTLLLKHCGVSRFAYNWGLNRKENIYTINQLPIPHIKYPTAIDLHRELNKLKKTDYQWMYEVSKCSPQEALRDLDDAYIRFFRCQAKHPKFKSKKKGVGSFRLTGIIKVNSKMIQLPRMGKIRLKESGYLPHDTHILSATISEKCGRWFVSIQVEENITVPINNNPVVGVDLCVSDKIAHCSDNIIFPNPRPLRQLEHKKKRIQREVSRRKKGSNNRRKSVRKLQKIEMKIANIRRDIQHKATTILAKNKSVIGMEDLNVSGMMKNHNLAKSVSDAGIGEFYRQMEYKTTWYGSKLITADRFYPSSKTCSRCGYIHKDLILSDRVFVCPVCNFMIDRDLNASVNLERFAISSMENLNACQSREVSFPSGKVLDNEAGNEYHIGDVLNG